MGKKIPALTPLPNPARMNDSVYDVVILGAGAAGLMCALTCGQRGLKVAVLEKSKKPGRKILISGGGRCNFTNLYASPENYSSENPHFCKSALSRYTQWDFISLVEKHGLTWTEKTMGQLFCDQKSVAIVDMLLSECHFSGVQIFNHTDVTGIRKNGSFGIASNRGDFTATNLVVATGGPSIPKMGATDFSQQLARQFGLRTLPFRPALVPLTVDETLRSGFFKDLSGVSFPAEVSCGNVSFRESVLITHRGLSGPAILQISSFWNNGDYLGINLLPDTDALSTLIQAREKRPNTLIANMLTDYLPRRFAQRFCDYNGGNKPLRQLQARDLETIAANLTSWVVQPDGSEGMRTAEVCAGGVDCDELSSKSFECKKVPGLYFIGEAIDVTGQLGGYNFQWAWSSGWCCGQSITLS